MDKRRIHFIGIGGVSMRSLAEYTANFTAVTGSDAVEAECFARLKKRGIEVYRGSDIKTVKEADLVVYTGAVPQDDPELSYAKNSGIPVMERCAYLKVVADTCRRTIAVAGTHGKTSTTGMIAHMFNSAGVKMVAHVGGDIPNIGGNYLYTGSDAFVTEACEYKRSFLCLTPAISVITNVEYDHPDCYKDLADVEDAFRSYAARSEAVLINDVYARVLDGADLSAFDTKVVTYGYTEDADYRITGTHGVGGRYSFTMTKYGKFFGEFKLNVYGAHNVENSAAAIAVSDMSGISVEKIKNAVETWCGAKRRFECRGLTKCGARVISDYAHHPDEICTSLKTAREIAAGKIIMCFEPHTYSRTKELLAEFTECFYWADTLIILPTYAARELPSAGLPATALADALRAKGRMPVYIESYEKAAECVAAIAEKNDLILVVGAGTVDNLCSLLLK